MERTTAMQDKALLAELHKRRAELRDSMAALEQALAGPVSAGSVSAGSVSAGSARWAERVHVALVELEADVRQHVLLTEGPDGLYAELSESAPRLSEAIAQLTREHGEILGALDDLLAAVAPGADDMDADHVRQRGTALLGRLVRHRQRGADLVYEAYEFDIGGDT